MPARPRKQTSPLADEEGAAPKRSSSSARRVADRTAGTSERASERVRLSPDHRERQILSGAIAYFAERGFGGQTRELADQLGISKGLLYRYFPGKDALIERIYEEMFIGQWRAEWDRLLADRTPASLPRLKLFYREYAKARLLNKDWVRIYLLSGLAGASINRRYARFIAQRVYEPVTDMLRAEHGRPNLTEMPISEAELELMWGLHGAIFYIGVRKWVHQVKVPKNADGAVALLVENFYANAARLMGGS